MPDDRALAMNYGFMNLDALMSDPGVGDLESVSCDCFVIDRQDDGGEVRKAWAVMGIDAVKNMLKVKEEAGAKWGELGYEEWAERAMGEFEKGAHWVSRAAVFVGRKRG